MQVSKKRTRKDGTVAISYVCTPCNTEYHRERKKNLGADYVREIYKRTYEKHKDKWIARAKARYAVKTGKLVKPTKCEGCELKKPLQGHHPDHSKPLEVIWLCSTCHAEEHNRLRRLTTP